MSLHLLYNMCKQLTKKCSSGPSFVVVRCSYAPYYISNHQLFYSQRNVRKCSSWQQTQSVTMVHTDMCIKAVHKKRRFSYRTAVCVHCTKPLLSPLSLLCASRGGSVAMVCKLARDCKFSFRLRQVRFTGVACKNSRVATYRRSQKVGIKPLSAMLEYSFGRQCMPLAVSEMICERETCVKWLCL